MSSGGWHGGPETGFEEIRSRTDSCTSSNGLLGSQEKLLVILFVARMKSGPLGTHPSNQDRNSAPTPNFLRISSIRHQRVRPDCRRFAPTNAVNQYQL